MFLEILIAIIFGLIAGGVINALADELPFRSYLTNIDSLKPPDDADKQIKQEFELYKEHVLARRPRDIWPVYGDGTPRPPSAWLGTSAFLLGQRRPTTPKPDDLRRRDHQDGNALTWRYPLTEIVTVLLMVITVIATANDPNMTIPQLVIYWLYMAILMLVTVIDIEHKIIPRVVILPGILLAVVDALLLPEPGPDLQVALLGGLLGFGVFYVFYLGGLLFSRAVGTDEVAFGLGDVLLITFSGVMLGWAATIFTIIVAIFLGAAGALGFIILKVIVSRRYESMTALPYGPYIVIATIIMLLYPDLVLSLWGF